MRLEVRRFAAVQGNAAYAPDDVQLLQRSDCIRFISGTPLYDVGIQQNHRIMLGRELEALRFLRGDGGTLHARLEQYVTPSCFRVVRVGDPEDAGYHD